MFALGQANGASQHQVASINSTTTKATTPQPPAQPRRFIDGAASTLTVPFHPLVHSTSEWATRIAYTVLALIVYGFGLGYLARWART
jgi:hypothetical protein